MTVKRPNLDEIQAIGKQIHMRLDSEEAKTLKELLESNLAVYDVLDSIPEDVPPILYPRDSGFEPDKEDNPYNAWYWKTEIQGELAGPLRGKRVAFKDNIMVASTPMMNGSSTLEGYIPEVDATAVTRVLASGGTVVGKAHSEYFCTSAGEIDMAVGTDHGGSCRIPASFCGVVGLKPTFGLVPYTGAMPIDMTIDYVGPMTKSVEDNALLLGVLAGADGVDNNQAGIQVSNYLEGLDEGVGGLRIGVVREGFGHDNSDPQVDLCVRNAAARLKSLGAEVEEISIPMHSVSAAIWTPIYIEGLVDSMMHDNGYGKNRRGGYVASLMSYHSNWRTQTHKFGPQTKLVMLTGEYMSQTYGGKYYAKAQNLRSRLTAAYDEALSKCDILLMPTLPITAPPIPASSASPEEIVSRALEMVPNTPATDLTGHPSISIPCGEVDNLPVGLMLVGRHFEEKLVYKAAYAFEQSESN
jgi:amidase